MTDPELIAYAAALATDPTQPGRQLVLIDRRHLARLTRLATTNTNTNTNEENTTPQVLADKWENR